MRLLTRFTAATTLAFLVLTTMVSPAAAQLSPTEDRSGGTTSSASFTDVAADAAFYKEIMWLAEKGVSTGWPDGTYRPFQGVTRDAMAAFMYRLAGSPEYTPAPASPFIDVPTTYQFYKEISWLADMGITTGWSVPSGNEFRPWNLITRDAMAAFLYRYKGSPDYVPTGSSPFIDVTSSSAFHTEIRWLAAQGISTGWDAAYRCRAYRPFGNVARDAMAAFMYRATLGGTTPVEEGTCAPPPGPAVTDPVTSGAFCKVALEGWYGYTENGVLMRCTKLGSETIPRWRAA